MSRKKEKRKESPLEQFIAFLIFIFLAYSLCNRDKNKNKAFDNGENLSYRTYYCKITSANIRSKPTTKSNIIGKAKLGDKIKVTDSLNNWYKINLNNQEGWIYKKLLSEYKIRVSASVMYDAEGFYITNLNNFDWKYVIFKLNYGLTGTYRAKRELVKAGETIRIPFYEFIKNDGERFNIYSEKPKRFMVWPVHMNIDWWEGQFN